MSLEKEDLVQALDEVFNKRRGNITDEQHKLDHDFVQELIHKRQRREAWIGKAKSTALGTIVVIFISGVVSGLAWVGNLIASTWHSGS